MVIILLNLFCNENVYYLLCSCTNSIFRKNLVPEVYAKMLSANQIAWFLNEIFLQSKLSKSGLKTLKFTRMNPLQEWMDGINWFLHAGRNSCTLKGDQKFIGLAWSRIVWSLDSKIDFISKLNKGINWFFACWYKFRKAKNWFNHFWVGLLKNGSGLLVHETLKSAVS